VSVFIGLIISLGSTGIVNQVMSGLTVTYSRALRVGDYVRVGDIEGTVTHLGTLSTKVETPRHEEVTIPNAVLISRELTNYSKDASASRVFVPTSVTIGYDAPWRQIHALLLLAAERTAGLRREPAPLVWQAGLEDFYIKYTLLVCLEDPRQRLLTLAALHANIQDVFNEYGVGSCRRTWTDPRPPKSSRRTVGRRHRRAASGRGRRLDTGCPTFAVASTGSQLLDAFHGSRDLADVRVSPEHGSILHTNSLNSRLDACRFGWRGS
jgi:hypothetical protein